MVKDVISLGKWDLSGLHTEVNEDLKNMIVSIPISVHDDTQDG